MSIEHLEFQDRHRIAVLITRKVRREQRRHEAAVARTFRRLAVTV